MAALSAKPRSAKAEVVPLGDGRWAYVVDGLVHFTAYSREDCEKRAAIIAGNPLPA
jgi:hypothetical protein